MDRDVNFTVLPVPTRIEHGGCCAIFACCLNFSRLSRGAPNSNRLGACSGTQGIFLSCGSRDFGGGHFGHLAEAGSPASAADLGYDAAC